MPSANYVQAISIGGVSIDKRIIRTFDHPNPYEISLPAGKVVTSWVKTGADTADCNLPADHGYTNGNFDVYWTDGGVPKRRYGVPGTIATNALSLDGGSGDDFPASATVGVVVTRQVQINTAIDGDAIEIIALSLEVPDQNATSKGHITFKDAATDVIAEVDLTANEPVIHDVAAGNANPFTGDPITAGYATNGNSEYDAVLKILSGEDATP